MDEFYNRLSPQPRTRLTHLRQRISGRKPGTYRLSCAEHGLIDHVIGLEVAEAAADVHQAIHGHIVVVTGPEAW